MKYLLLAIGLVLSLNTLSQDKRLCGTIVDYDTKEPVPWISVFLKSKRDGKIINDYKVITGADGKFELVHDFLDSVDLVLKDIAGSYDLPTIIQNVHIDLNTILPPIPIFGFVRNYDFGPLPRKQLRKIEKNKKNSKPKSLDNFTNGFIEINCGEKKYSMHFGPDETIIVEFKDLMNCSM